MSKFLTRSYDGPDFDAIGRKFEDFKRKLQGLQAQVRNLAARTPLHFYSAVGDSSQANYSNDGATAEGAMAIGIGATSTNVGATVIGNNARATGHHAIVLGNAVTSGNNSTLIGGDSDRQAMTNTMGGAMLIGRGIQNTGSNTLIISRNFTNSSTTLTQVGYRADVTPEYGGGSYATGIGKDTVVIGDYGVAIGADAIATDANTVSFGNTLDEWRAARNRTSGGSDRFRRVVNIADGVNAHDAVTVAQLSALSWHAGDTATVTNLNTGGFVTSSGRSHRFTIPLCKPVGADVSGVTLSGNVTVRQNNSYLFSNVDVSTFSVSVSLSDIGVSVACNASDAPSGVTNNSPIGVLFNGTVTFN